MKYCMNLKWQIYNEENELKKAVKKSLTNQLGCDILYTLLKASRVSTLTEAQSGDLWFIIQTMVIPLSCVECG